jgi:LysM repeat protein
MTRELSDARYLPKFGQFLNGNFYYQTAADWMPTKATNGGTASFVATGSRWTVNLATNASSAPVAPQRIASVTQEHKVRPGETLWRIARSYRTSVEALRAQNNLANDLLRVGQVLRVVTDES